MVFCVNYLPLYLNSLTRLFVQTLLNTATRQLSRQALAVADGPARRAASFASCCTWMLTPSATAGQARRSKVDSCKCCQLSTDDDRLFIAPSVHLCRTKLMTRCDDRRAVIKLSESSVCDKVSEGSTLTFEV